MMGDSCMSKQIKKAVVCPHCSKKTNTEIWSSINVTQTPSLRQKVMDQSLFLWKCPFCGYQAELLYPFLYHDMKHNFMVYFIPNWEQIQSLQYSIIEKDFPQLTIIQKRLVLSFNDLKEKILIFEAGLDDRAIELTKFALFDVLTKKRKQPVCIGFFFSLDQSSNHLKFSFFSHNEPEPFFQSTRMEVYQKSLDIITKFSGDDDIKTKFQKIDSAFASKILIKHRNSLEK